MLIFRFQGVSLIKMGVTGLVWISLAAAIREFFQRHAFIKKGIPRLSYIMLMLLFVWNITSILRSVVTRDDTMTTIFGNVFTSLALLAPFVIAFSFRKSNIKIMHSYLRTLLYVAISLTFFFFVITLGALNEITLGVSFLLLVPVVFLITLFPFLNKITKVVLFVAVPFLFYIASELGVRTMMIRELLLLTCLAFLFVYYKKRAKIVLVVSFMLLILPFALLQEGYVTGESPFEKYLSGTSDDNLSTDTRTFLYLELFQDLVENQRFLIGKGATGKYYSEYFSSFEGDSSSRINVEVGVLSILLKGGLISVTLHLGIMILSIFYAFFRSKNLYVIGAGFTILIHTVLLFIENIVIYNTYNILIWSFVGICLSKEVRNMGNREIVSLMSNKK